MKSLEYMQERIDELNDRIVIGDSFYMLSEKYLNHLNELPVDVLINLVIKLTKDNKDLKSEIKSLEGCIHSITSTMGR